MKKLTTEQFVERAKEVHGDKYDYSLTEYIGALSKISIICFKHGIFKVTPNGHISKKSGCSKCGKDSIAGTTEIFTNKANKIHNSKYKYNKVKYINSFTKIIITCPIHGDFEQRPNDHLSQKQGCPNCGKEKVAKLKKENPRGWSTSRWLEISKNSKYFDSFKVYVVRCWNDEEEFYKIGRTYVKIKDRFDSKGRMPYNFEVLKIFKGEAEEISKLEKQLQKENKQYKYLPQLTFDGFNECFSKLISYNE